MKKYKVLVRETLERIVEVEAEDDEEAFDKVLLAYQEEEIVLDYEDLVDNLIIVKGEVEN